MHKNKQTLERETQCRGMLLSNNKNLPEAEMHKHETHPKGAEDEQNLIKAAIKSPT